MEKSDEKPNTLVITDINAAEENFNAAAENENIDFYTLFIIKDKLTKLKQQGSEDGKE